MGSTKSLLVEVTKEQIDAIPGGSAEPAILQYLNSVDAVVKFKEAANIMYLVRHIDGEDTTTTVADLRSERSTINDQLFGNFGNTQEFGLGYFRDANYIGASADVQYSAIFLLQTGDTGSSASNVSFPASGIEPISAANIAIAYSNRDDNPPKGRMFVFSSVSDGVSGTDTLSSIDDSVGGRDGMATAFGNTFLSFAAEDQLVLATMDEDIGENLFRIVGVDKVGSNK